MANTTLTATNHIVPLWQRTALANAAEALLPGTALPAWHRWMRAQVIDPVGVHTVPTTIAEHTTLVTERLLGELAERRKLAARFGCSARSLPELSRGAPVVVEALGRALAQVEAE